MHILYLHYLLSILLLCSSRSHSRPIHLSLTLRHPRPSRPGSSHGFPTTLRLFTPRTPHPFISRLLNVPHFTSRSVQIDLLGGITQVGEYYTRISIGGQYVRVQVDTGSSTLALPLAECDRCLPSDQRYNPKLSHTGHARWISCNNDLCRPDSCSKHHCDVCSAKDACCSQEYPEACGFQLKYGDGSLARGALMVDLMSWGGVSAPVIFGGILHDSEDFERPIVDGILGMAYKALACNPTCVEPPFQQMVKAGVIEDSFTICITGHGGKMVLGEYDSSLAKGNMTYVPLTLSDPPMFYNMNVSNHVRIGDKEIGIPNMQVGILDSGTTLVVVSETTFLIFLKAMIKFHCDIPGLCDTDKPWFMPASCVKMSDDILKRMPTFVFHLGPNKEFDLELRPQDYMLKMDKPGHMDYRCVGIMAMREMHDGTDIIFGNTVMQRYVSHYDRRNNRLGFAEAAEGCGSAPDCATRTQCRECAAEKGCSFNLRTQKCQQAHDGLGLIPYPECSGSSCLCGMGRQADLAFGVLDGLLGSLLIVVVGFFVFYLYSRREPSGGSAGIGRGGDHEPIYTLEGEDEDSALEDGPDGRRPGKEYMPVPTS